MGFDLALILVILAVVTGVIWGVDAWLFAGKRKALAGDGEPAEPAFVEYSRTFFPVIVIVLLIRSFAYEPFRIPSSSMMPTLLVGDFIFVNKYDFGLRLPVVHTKILEIGEPRRGDVVVFRLPADPSTNYIKRVVGLPGDVVRYENKRLTINGERVSLSMNGPFSSPGQGPSQIGTEVLGDAEHNILLSLRQAGHEGTFTVPEGHYFVMGDNRDNSQDSRYPKVGFVPESHLVGRAVRIWLNIGKWSRIGDSIT